MKRILMALFSLYAAALPCICQTKTCMAGLDMTTLLHKDFTAQAYYSFSDHWSVKAEASIPFSILKKQKSETEKAHETEFENSQESSADASYHRESISVNYWPIKAFSGINISVGIRTGGRTSIITLAEIGYMFHIWKNIHINTSFQIPLHSNMEEKAFSSENLRISLSYKF